MVHGGDVVEFTTSTFAWLRRPGSRCSRPRQCLGSRHLDVGRHEGLAAWVPDGNEVAVAVKGHIYPTSLAFADDGTTYAAEADYSYGDPAYDGV